MLKLKTRPEQLKDQYLEQIDKHLNDLVSGKATDMHEIEDLAALCLYTQHT